MTQYRRITGAAVILLFAVATLAMSQEKVVSGAASSGTHYGFLVDGGHLYLPYLYYQWIDDTGKLTGTRESLEPSGGNSGYVVHRNRFSGTRSGEWLSIRYLNGQFMRGVRERLHFVHGRLYVRESQTGAVWWAPGKAMTSSGWALTAIRFMECYTNPYDAGNIDRKCTNHG